MLYRRRVGYSPLLAGGVGQVLPAKCPMEIVPLVSEMFIYQLTVADTQADNAPLALCAAIWTV